MAGNFEIEFEAPWGVRFLERLTSFSRVILFDKRGTGLSDRVLGAPDFDMRADDLRAVLDDARSKRAVLVGNRGGGSLAALYAAAHPDRVLALVLYNSWARTSWAPDYPVGTSPEELGRWRAEIEAHWGTEHMAKRFLENVASSRANDPAWVRWEAKALRQGASPASALAFDEFEQAIDVRSVLATVQVRAMIGRYRGKEIDTAGDGFFATFDGPATGSGLVFEDKGEHELKGVPGLWHLYRVLG